MFSLWISSVTSWICQSFHSISFSFTYVTIYQYHIHILPKTQDVVHKVTVMATHHHKTFGEVTWVQCVLIKCFKFTVHSSTCCSLSIKSFSSASLDDADMSLYTDNGDVWRASNQSVQTLRNHLCVSGSHHNGAADLPLSWTQHEWPRSQVSLGFIYCCCLLIESLWKVLCK